MFWIVIFVLAALAAVAFGWVSFQLTSQRAMIIVEIEKFGPAYATLKDATEHLFAKGKELFEHARNE